MTSKQLILFSVLAGIVIFLLSKIFWIGVLAIIIWIGIEIFKRSDTYKKYNK